MKSGDGTEEALKKLKAKLENKIAQNTIPPTNLPDIAEIIKQDEANRKEKLANDGLQNDLELKKKICYWVIWVVSIYLAFIAIIIGFQAINYSLSDPVLIAILTTTTINVLGLPLMIILSLFPKPPKNRS